MIDADAQRHAALVDRVPDTVWLVVYAVTAVAMMAMGYRFGVDGDRNWMVFVLMALAFAAVMMLIGDLDRPARGLVKVSQQPLLDLIEKIGAPPPQ
jgi:hypothetical protein